MSKVEAQNPYTRTKTTTPAKTVNASQLNRRRHEKCERGLFLRDFLAGTGWLVAMENPLGLTAEIRNLKSEIRNPKKFKNSQFQSR
jgi:hypothetical protein